MARQGRLVALLLLPRGLRRIGGAHAAVPVVNFIFDVRGRRVDGIGRGGRQDDRAGRRRDRPRMLRWYYLLLLRLLRLVVPVLRW